MKVALYTGNHSADTLLVRFGWWITRLVQKGPFSVITHAEAIHEEYADGSVTIASSSIRDGGVRSKRTVLDEGSWQIVDIPQWDVALSAALLTITQGEKYDWRGAIATVFLGSPETGRWFCNEWVAAPYLKASGTFAPNQFAAVALSLGEDITQAFFAECSSKAKQSVAQ